MKTALVVIDVQKGFAVEKASNLPEKIVEHLKNNKYDYALFTISHNIELGRRFGDTIY
jgi:nicotinamidase-related amidase